MISYIQENKLHYREEFFSDSYLDKNIHISKNISIIAVVHIIDTGIPYIKTLEKYFSLEYIIPKPKSIDKNFLKYIPKTKILNLNKKNINYDNIIIYFDKIPKDNKIILLDIGGYFANVGNKLKERFGNRFIGIIEDTENGYMKYKQVMLKFPVISVAKSLLKENEDFLVGQAIVFSVESLLREQGILINSKNVGIIGSGKIGNGVLSSLKSKSSQIHIFDIDPINLVIAYSRGNKIVNRIEILNNSDILFCATGNISLKGDDFKYLKNGVFVASVTSSDDEMDLSWVENNYEKEKIAKFITKYEKNGHYFFLINDGNAVNFLHGAVVDDFILLVQKEIIDSIIELSKNSLKNKIHGGFDYVKTRIADSWLKKILKINI